MNNNSKKNKYLIKNTFALSIGNFGSKLITFFLVPLYTNVLTTSEYGTLDLITIISTVIVPIITLNIQEAVMRFTMDKNSDKNKILSVAFLIMLLSVALGIISWPIFNSISITKQYSLLLVFYMLTHACSHIFLCYIRGEEKLLDYSIISIIQTLIIALLNIYFLLVLKIGIYGFIYAYIIAFSVTTILCIIRGNIIKKIMNFKIEKKLAYSMIKYSIILIPNSLMWWIMNSLDRVMVTSIISVEENGIYAVSYKIPTIIITITTLFNQAWMFSAIKEKESANKDEYTSKIYSTLYNIVITISIFLFLVLKPLMKIYVGSSFYLAWMYTPPLILGTIFLTMGSFLSNEYTANKDSAGFLKSSTIGAIINIILNLLLIPLIGSLGAAIATCVSYIALFVFRIYDTKKYVSIKYFDRQKNMSIILIIISTLSIYLDSIISFFILFVLLVFQLINTKDLWKSIYKSLIKMIKNKED